MRTLTAGQTARAGRPRRLHYVRNSVKATVDAYTGKVELFQVDGDDPVLKTWMKVFPGTVKPSPISKARDLRQHVRYPRTCSRSSARCWPAIVDDPTEFLPGGDFWSIPADPTADQTVAAPVPANEDRCRQTAPTPEVQAPYYFTAAAPGDLQRSVPAHDRPHGPEEPVSRGLCDRLVGSGHLRRS